ncbi:4-phosphoerythronate dehydrogenase [Pseudohongiella sp.]|uniref:Erythronate-4-phosphate dehydrogenase n=1 Tax=marine sediment metagenome TaxID=412755 RepID=A0A0F9Z443_9ZZZZ|nr:4-phosphoerythronate dehydrogenase [Pseudohongiella sp.]HDZ08541.1 4-phosphoerythronate dehydrogenase [Pseudohongiella sp.]HEA61721.1 4-phosphoerythronate dehydrogenase [Pseudohongiella sp.]
MSGKRIKIVADENILALDGWFGKKVELVLVPGRDIRAEHVQDADALLVRSITRVDKNLLQGSTVRFVGTATSGTDHLDLAWLAQQDITVADAAGANANAVVEYVLAALASLIKEEGLALWQSRVAVIGAGHVGSALIRRLQSLGIQCVACDPLQQIVNNVDYVGLDEALRADVVCLHTPLTRDGKHATWHMLDQERLSALRPETVLINAGRGEVIETAALLELMQRVPEQKVILDVWENEPSPALALLRKVAIGTPHIAGYSVEAKLAASRFVLTRLCEHFDKKIPAMLPPTNLPLIVHDERYTAAPRFAWDGDQSDEHMFADIVLGTFSPALVSQRFTTMYQEATAEQSGARVFDRLRRELAMRREFSACHLHAAAYSPQLASWLHAAGFVLQA